VNVLPRFGPSLSAEFYVAVRHADGTTIGSALWQTSLPLLVPCMRKDGTRIGFGTFGPSPLSSRLSDRVFSGGASPGLAAPEPINGWAKPFQDQVVRRPQHIVAGNQWRAANEGGIVDTAYPRG
jgi:hypothetical protein